ncbi:MAG: 4'-phosphopantetheinyl transferase superfamily protein [Gammaproteobacteria bacterium]|nr:4'-phosphopantetheinyl transferase superfamily protein [Gammaproteobacteria bacterium]
MAFPVSDEIHLWVIDESSVDDALLAPCGSLLSADELQRHARLRLEGDRRRFLITRAAIRSVLSSYFPDAQPAQWQFSRNAWGRPAIAAPVLDSGIQFNISHAQGLIVIAVTERGDLGVDVEYTGRRCRTLALANRYFSKQEIAALQSLSVSAQRERFFDLWTLKEAYIKACGMGLAIPLRSFSFEFAKDGISIAFAPERCDDPGAWQFWQMQASPEHRLAIALKSSNGLRPMKVVCRPLVPAL